MVFSFLGSLIGFSFSLVLRIELNSPFTVLGEYFYYVSLTSHGVIMVFYFLTVLATGFYSYLTPEMCFLNEMYFSKLNITSFILTVISLLIIILSLFIGEMVNTG